MFVRRYPFVLAQDDANNFNVCFDAAYDGWHEGESEGEGRGLFVEDGGNSPFLDEMIQFLQNFSAEMERTRRFVVRLEELGLLTKRTLQLTHANGETFVLTDFQAVDEEKFLKLDDAEVLDLHKSGFLGWIYAHLMSLGNANRLFSHLVAQPLLGRVVLMRQPGAGTIGRVGVELFRLGICGGVLVGQRDAVLSGFGRTASAMSCPASLARRACSSELQYRRADGP